MLDGEIGQADSPRCFSLSLGDDADWQRLDACLGQALAGRLSREKIKKAILQGAVTLNGAICQSPKSKAGPGDEVRLSLEPAFASASDSAAGPVAEEGPLDILYQDADLAVINKPAGLTVHPCPSCPNGTLVNRLLAHFPELKENAFANDCEAESFSEEDDFEGFPPQSGDRPGIVHRLDKDTTGLLLVALNEATRLKLAGVFAARQVKKEYLALVYGVPAEREGVINVPIGRDPVNKTRMTALPDALSAAAKRPGPFDPSDLPEGIVPPGQSSRSGASSGGRDALSEYRTLYSDQRGLFSLLAVRIHTGRTHQIRVHLRFLGHPIIGDAVYFDYRAIRPVLEPFLRNRPDVLKNGQTLREFINLFATRPLLHAWKLSFEHPQCSASFGRDAASDVVDYNESGEQPHELSFICPPPEDFYACLTALGPCSQPVILTGNVGCGKSSVLAGLKRRGIPVWSADRAVADLYRPGQSGWHMLRSAFGSRFVPDGAAEVDKKALFAAMCEDERLRREVEKLIHPLAAGAMWGFFADCPGLPGLPETADKFEQVTGQSEKESANKFERETMEKPEQAVPLAVAEVPLYFEAGWAAKTAAGTQKIGNSAKLPDSAELQGASTKTLSAPLVLGIHCPREIRVERLRLKRGWPDAMIDKMESWQWDEAKKMRACDLVLDNSGSLEDLDGRIEIALTDLAARRERDLREMLEQVRDLVSGTE
jgi:23S rRNA pseudouridine1911/1915/1917 synthase